MMKQSTLLKVATESIARNKMRSLLTMLGIVIGVAAVILMVAIGNGASLQIESSIKKMGTNVIMIMPMSLSSTSARICMSERSLAMRKSCGVEKFAATVWPTSTLRSTMTPSMGA